MSNIYELFKAEVAKVKRERGLTNKDIAQLTGYKKQTIDLFMSKRPGRDDSSSVARAISNALKIQI